MASASPELLQSNSITSLSVALEFSGPALGIVGLPRPYKVKMLVNTKTKKVTFERFRDYYRSWTPTQTEVGKIRSADELLNFPFYLADPEILTQQVDRPMPENGEEWTTLEDAFPNSYPTHTKFQKYDFDVGYRLMRIHYIVDVLKRPAPAWHNCFNHAIAGKLLYPTLRLVTSSLPDMAFFFFPSALYGSSSHAAKTLS
ncbi:hypothetical protein M419DRAFT_128586 [Trichoderma reesei RUT C-30]|uniref:Uncharacterized protein n=1 Tax=Hypocrea jecorina (strain ATCC 56765 / BCRC 32924 / NRRL 11460 / Rut C-30) TaxID=1344414 RepID=A0A024SD94_HYPJR|nr:hypothetical protein M419DRAFT_128586 [Trichoderma reesei RUT C-30]